MANKGLGNFTRAGIAALTLGLLGVSWSAPAQGADPAAAKKPLTRKEIRTLTDLARAEECTPFLPKMQSLIARQYYTSLDRSTQSYLLYFYSSCAAEHKQYEQSVYFLPYWVELARDEEGKLARQARQFSFLVDAKKTDAAHTLLMALLENKKADPDELSTSALLHHWFNLQFVDDAMAKRFAMVKALTDRKYEGFLEVPGEFADVYANALAAQGEVGKAGDLLLKYPSLAGMIQTHVSNLYADLRTQSGFDTRYALQKGLDAQLAQAMDFRKKQEKKKDRGENKLEYETIVDGTIAYWQLTSGNVDGARETVQTALGKLNERETRANDDVEDVDIDDKFTDFDKNLKSGMLHLRAVIYGIDGKVDEMFATQQEAIKTATKSAGKYSGMVELAGMQLEAGKMQDALDTMQTASKEEFPDEDDLAKGAVIRVCAHATLDQMPEAETAFAELKTYEKDISIFPVRQALICMNRMDEAAALTVKTLQNPLTRESTLYGMQVWKNYANSDWHKEFLEKSRAVNEMPVVQDALKPIGTIMKVPYFSH